MRRFVSKIPGSSSLRFGGSCANKWQRLSAGLQEGWEANENRFPSDKFLIPFGRLLFKCSAVIAVTSNLCQEFLNSFDECMREKRFSEY